MTLAVRRSYVHDAITPHSTRKRIACALAMVEFPDRDWPDVKRTRDIMVQAESWPA